GNAENIDALIDEYSTGDEIERLESKVMDIKILDPACGSGAFLNKASDILLDIHKAIYDFKKKKYTTTIETKGGKGKDKVKRTATHSKLDSYFNEAATRREILINNIYGVDLNEESVDITKLAFFLKVAQKKKKLPDLDKNIKCGNSIIADKNVANNAFNWELEFEEIFRNGYFDIVIGNPPYVFTRGKNFSKVEKDYYSKNYGKLNSYPKDNNRKSQSGKINLFTLFIEKSINLVKNGGRIGLIVPNNLLRTTTYDMTRFYVLNSNKISKIVDLTSGVFDKVTASTIAIVLDKENDESLRDKNRIEIITDISDLKEGIYNNYNINQNSFIKNPSYAFNIYVTTDLFEIFEKIRNQTLELHNFTKDIIEGIVTPKGKSKFISNVKKSDLYKKYLEGKDIKRYYISYKGKYILYDRKKLHRPRRDEIFNCKEKLLIQRISGGKRVIKAAYDNEQHYTFASLNNLLLKDESPINIKFLLILLNSKLINTYYNLNFTNKSDLTVNISSTYLEKLPIYMATPQEQAPFIEKANLMLQLNKEFHDEVNNFHNWLQRTFNIEKLSQKLGKYYELDFEEFMKEVKKKKVDIKSRETQELLENEFNESLAVVNPLLQKIEEIDREIDEMVYDLYGLTLEEREIVEESLK
ncbi:MAG: N-6 DNA methylase, partial [Methanobacterium paludis]|nr:N-6 DNA methylase [Methanobacterium paludis]